MLVQGQKEQARFAKRTATAGPSDILGENIDVDILTQNSLFTLTMHWLHRDHISTKEE